MKAVLGIILILASIVGGLYVGLWLCFVGGIVQVIEAIKATPVEAMDIGIGLLRVASSAIAGWGSFFIGFFGGAALIGSQK